MTTLREYKSLRPVRILYETITIANDVVGSFRMVNNQIFEKTFGGEIYLPCRMEVIESQQSNTPIIDATVKFGRMASGFKYVLNKWKDHNRLTPISAIYRQWDSAFLQSPIKEWSLFISDISLDQNDVTCQMTLKNPLNSNIGLMYDIEEFPGLRSV